MKRCFQSRGYIFGKPFSITLSVRGCSSWKIPMIPEQVRKSVFKTPQLDYEEQKRLQKCVRKAAVQITGGENLTLKNASQDDTDFPQLLIPEVFGSSILDHFETIGEKFVEPIEKVIGRGIESYSARELRRPCNWQSSPGWTVYDSTGIGSPGNPGVEELLVFDVEVNVLTSQYYPIMATAYAPLSGKWYSWTSPVLWDASFQFDQKDVFEYLIPIDYSNLEDSFTVKPRQCLIIGHNVAFDRQYIKDEYQDASRFCKHVNNEEFSGRSGRHNCYTLRYLDTMAMHQAVCGVTQLQMNIIAGRNSPSKESSTVDSSSKISRAKLHDDSTTLIDQWEWTNKCSKANLVDVFRLHCGSFPLHMGQKSELRNIFVSGTMDDIRNNFHQLMSYCAQDVTATYELFCKLYPQYRYHNPHPVTFAGSLLMGNSRLPADGLWDHYKKACNSIAKNKTNSLDKQLRDIALSVGLDSSEEGKKGRENIWLKQLDWSDVELTQKKNKEIFIVASGGREIIPKWLFALIDKDTEQVSLSLKMHITPLLMQMKYKGFPLFHKRDSGWCFVVPNNNEKVLDLKSEGYKEVKLLMADFEKLGCSKKQFSCFKIPHASGKKSLNVGTPFAHDYIKLVEAGILTSDTHQEFLKSFIETEKATRFWASNKSRICNEQLHVQVTAMNHRNKDSAVNGEKVKENGWILPKMCVHGTLTRRATENTWLVATNAQTNCVGGELKSMLRAPNGFKFVGADVDAEEIWIAGLIGDSSGDITDGEFGLAVRGHGVSPLGWMVVAGDKGTKTDMHSFTARQLNLSRDEAKRANGFKFVGADVDAEEIWIAGLIGDSSGDITDGEFGLAVRGHGVSPLGWMVVAGDKGTKTDMHSFTARQLNLSRDEAKVVNYGRVYGAGLSFLKQYLEQNAEMPPNEALMSARRLLSTTKGLESHVLSRQASKLLRSILHVHPKSDSLGDIAKLTNSALRCYNFTAENILKAVMSDTFRKLKFKFLNSLTGVDLTVDQISLEPQLMYMFSSLVSRLTKESDLEMQTWTITQMLVERKRYINGTESAMFSKLEKIATMKQPRTPFLGSLITRALQPDNCGSAEMPSRINWVVQSSAVDFLHLLLVAVEWLKTEYDVEMMFTLSIHDEIRYLVSNRDVELACWVLQVAHLLTRAFFSASVGINDLPASVAYFSSIDVDTVLRKEPSFECVTASNPLGLEKGYGIKPGISVTPQDLSEKLIENKFELPLNSEKRINVVTL